MDKTILFDTGGDGRTLLENMRRLKLDPENIDAVVLSHVHRDHTGGLSSFAGVRTDVPVFIPTGFPAAFKERIQSLGLTPVEAPESKAICDGARTTGTLGQGGIEEHGLCIKTKKGWVLITGCAHPGIAELATQAEKVTGGPIQFVMGGVHMPHASESSIHTVIDRLEKLGMQQVVPTRCSGEQTRALFKSRLEDRCILAGAGSVFRLERGADFQSP
jgi:7,8-dihydropterin-6-yl-methyl-4-(beta-D-ribofuranosyl)aminobenzene 5'-phosphate synthase